MKKTMKTTMYKRVFWVSIAVLSLLGFSGCEKGSMYPPMDVTGKFVMIPKSERFKLYGHTVKAYLYELQDGEYLSYETCITGHIPSEFRSYDTINIKATMIHVAPEFEFCDDDASQNVCRLENIEKI